MLEEMRLRVLGWILLAAGAVGTSSAVVLEVLTHESVYCIIMKIAALCFGLGGGLVGVSSKSKAEGR